MILHFLDLDGWFCEREPAARTLCWEHLRIYCQQRWRYQDCLQKCLTNLNKYDYQVFWVFKICHVKFYIKGSLTNQFREKHDSFNAHIVRGFSGCLYGALGKSAEHLNKYKTLIVTEIERLVNVETQAFWHPVQPLLQTFCFAAAVCSLCILKAYTKGSSGGLYANDPGSAKCHR